MTSNPEQRTMPGLAPDTAGQQENPELVKKHLLEQAVELAPDLSELLRVYYRHVPAEELVDEPAELAGALRSHHRLAENRAPGRPVVQVFNPTRERDGWQSQSTVVQIVTDDMPYLVDSVVAGLVRQGARVQQVVHPIMVVQRDLTGVLHEVLPGADPAKPPEGTLAESWMFIEVDQIVDTNRLSQLEAELSAVLNDVREVVEDAERMRETALSLAEELRRDPPKVPPEEDVRDAAELLRWLSSGHFTFLGYSHYELDEGSDSKVHPVLASGLGVLRGDAAAKRNLASLPLTGPEELLVLTPASEPSTVPRPVHPFQIGLKTYDSTGKVNGEHRFLGLFTTTALHENVLDIPYIERRVRDVIHAAGFPLESYSGQRMLEEIQNYPRAELFATDPATLQETITGVLAVAERRKLKPFLRRDPYGRFFSCLVYLPRERYTTTSRLAMQEVLLAELNGTGLEYSTRVGESALARVHFTVHTDPEQSVEPDLARIQRRLEEAIHTWDDQMVEQVDAELSGREQKRRPRRGSEMVSQLGHRYAAAFPEAYKEDFTAADGLTDLHRLQNLTDEKSLHVAFYVPRDASSGERRFKIYVRGERMTLSQVLPVLQSMGVEVVDERPYEIVFDDDSHFWIYDFGLHINPQVLEGAEGDPQLDSLRERFEETFRAVWLGAAEVDRFNALVLHAGLTWRQAAMLRAYAKYLRQVGTAYSQDYIEDAILAHRTTTVSLVRLFETRFDPKLSDEERSSAEADLVAEVTKLIDEVTSIDADRILRSYLNLIRATLRTNYFVTGPDGPRPYLALKLEPKEIPGLPEPRPQYEVFVYSPRTEGVHLRFGSVARGGLRWSDRREDFRTEILGLVKAQAVKNAVIVPLGAKGGFVVKRPPAPTGDPVVDREAYQQEGIACYRMFISGLLDLTDNLVGGEVVPPQGVVRHDGDDTYLVVAADKGTAKFSDIANEVAKSYGFWLGDAFASGGSVGYDHKAMGITARGAWESVKRHFRELGVDVQSQDFTVVGIGDMAGDVFGNGMLLSEHIRLVAAFNHMHIFIDPDPDPAVSHAERRRLFTMPRSTWDDYDRSKISEGGGVWSRSLKSIPLNPHIRRALGIDESVQQMTPTELIKAILLAPVDLLWNGGIGTYVKASSETHAEVGDKSNDAVRVNGNELRVKVVGEGGNLGFTQRGRIEFARTGGKINTDALDNSAGVDCSDHEVNIKVLLDQLVTEGKLTQQRRNELLAEMTDEVAELVLRDNYRQNAVLGVTRAQAAELLPVHARQVAYLEQHAGLDRELEVLPSAKEFRQLEKTGTGLSSPELATLMAHVKLALKSELLNSDLLDADTFRNRLEEYFPEPLRQHYAENIAHHPLRRQITATLLVNDMVDHAGISYAYRLAEEIGASCTDAVRAFTAVTSIFDLRELWRQIDELDGRVPSSTADELVLETRRLLDRASRWMLSNRPQPLTISAAISRFRPVVAELCGSVRGWLHGQAAQAVDEKVERWTAQGVPAELAERVAVLLDAYSLLDITEIAELAEQDGTVTAEHSPQESAELYYLLSEHLDVEHMLQAVNALPRGDRWHSLARLSLRDDFYAILRGITVDVLSTSDPEDAPEQKIAKWESANESRLSRAKGALEQIRASAQLDLATLSVAARQMRNMVR